VQTAIAALTIDDQIFSAQTYVHNHSVLRSPKASGLNHKSKNERPAAMEKILRSAIQGELKRMTKEEIEIFLAILREFNRNKTKEPKLRLVVGGRR
jgi:hypothetical protein